MVYVVTRQEAGPSERRPKMLKGKLDDNSRNQVENWHSDILKKVQLTLSQGKKKKGDDVADDDLMIGEKQCVTRLNDRDTVH
jgi:hypothetical protein